MPQIISIHAPRVGRDPIQGFASMSAQNFNPRAPCGARRRFPRPAPCCRHFNPRAPCGARLSVMLSRVMSLTFQSTRPVWGATCSRAGCELPNAYFNPRAPCGARLFPARRGLVRKRISIHAPRVGRDDDADRLFEHGRISIHAPRVGRDMKSFSFQPCARPFQSTRPVWGATFCKDFFQIGVFYFNPRAPCGARPMVRHHYHRSLLISIHAPRVGRDYSGPHVCDVIVSISIHAPRVGRDRPQGVHHRDRVHFNPRAPCGARRSCSPPAARHPHFNPRAPCGARQQI